MDLTVTGDVVMIADVFPAAPEVVGLALTEGVVLRGLRAAAVQDNKGDGTHGGKRVESWELIVKS